jgi:hypothetical protein
MYYNIFRQNHKNVGEYEMFLQKDELLVRLQRDLDEEIHNVRKKDRFYVTERTTINLKTFIASINARIEAVVEIYLSSVHAAEDAGPHTHRNPCLRHAEELLEKNFNSARDDLKKYMNS